MPPKAQGPSKKNVEKKKEKVIEDKTFGLKNKKGAKQQKFVQIVTHQVKNTGQSAAQLEAQKYAKKKADGDELADLNRLFKPVADLNKLSKDVDPKSVLCAFFKQGLCKKGDRCKFSHDLDVERKTEKRNVYVDSREMDGEESMETWDEEKLNDVVSKKHGESEKTKPTTSIICKYFLEALETCKYGWFWECPNGEKCIYRHALPPGYILKKDRKKIEEQKKVDQISLEELIEKERTALGSDLTKVTLDSFLAWKRRKLLEKRHKATAEEKRKRADFGAGKNVGLSGRDMFTFNPDMVLDDDDEADDARLAAAAASDDEDEVEARDIDESLFMTLDDDDDEAAAVAVDAELFGGDDGAPPSSDDDEDEPGPSGALSNGVQNLSLAADPS